MSPNNEFFQDEKLDGTNYMMWSFKMQMFLKSKGLWQITNGIVKVENSNDDNEKSNEQAMAAIVLGLKESQIIKIMDAKTAFEMWDRLARYNQSSSLDKQMRLREKLSMFRFNSGDMKLHVERFDKLIMEIRTSGMTLSDPEACAILLKSLPNEYGSFVQACRFSAVAWELNAIREKVLSEAERLSETLVNNESTALEAHYGSKYNKHGKHRKQTKNKKNVTCFKCGKKGHYKSECYQKDESHVALWSSDMTHNSQDDIRWVIDSGATNHMCKNKDLFHNLKQEDNGREIVTAKNGAKIKVKGVGTIKMMVYNGKKLIQATMDDVLYVEDLSRNLFSIPAIMKKGLKIQISNDGCQILHGNEVKATGMKQGSLLYLNCVQSGKNKEKVDLMTWHRRLGHVNEKTTTNVIRNHGLHVEEKCEECQISKQPKKSYKKTMNKQYRSGLVCSDVIGPITPETVSGKRYAVTFIIMEYRYASVYLMRTKDEVHDMFKIFCRDILNRHNYQVRSLRSDNGLEYKNERLKKYCREKSISQEFTVPYNPEQNGMAERMNRTLIEMTRCYLNDSSMEKKYWGEAIMTAAYTKNRLPVESNKNRIPYEALNGKSADYKDMRVFGCKCYAHIPKEKRSKLENASEICRFLGYATDQKGYRLLSINTGNVIVSRSVIFEEAKFEKDNKYDTGIQSQVPLQVRGHQISNGTTETGRVVHDNDSQVQEEATSDKCDQDDTDVMNEEPNSTTEDPSGYITPPRKPGPYLDGPDPDILTYDIVTKLSETPGRDNEDESKIRPPRKKKQIEFELEDENAMYCLNTEMVEKELKYEDVIRSKDSEKWLKAMNDEIKSIKMHDTWEICKLPKGKKSIKCRWLFKIKRNPDNTISKYKARLCAKGFTQKYGVDYFDIFAPVIKLTTMRIALATAAKLDLEMRQCDVMTAFLNGELDEEIYMDQPEGFEVKGHEDKVCKLKKSLYGTKQAARQWNVKINQKLKEFGLTRSNSYPCLYHKISNDQYTLVALYVDDMIIFSNEMRYIDNIIEYLKGNFGIVDLGEPRYCLGIEIFQDRKNKRIFINQSTHIMNKARSLD